MADIISEANIDDEIARHVTKNIFKYWTSYRQGCLRYLQGMISEPGAASWVLETDQGDKLPSGEPGPGGEVVGWASWVRGGDSPVAKNWQRASNGWGHRIERGLWGLRSNYYQYWSPDPTNNRAAFGPLMAVVHKPFDQDIFKESWELGGLYVAPAYQRRGLAKTMIKWGLNQAAAEGVPAVVRASPAGNKVYVQTGFRSFEKIDFGGTFQSHGIGCHSLVWEPPGMEGKWYDRAKRQAEEFTKSRETGEEASETATE